MPGSRSSRPPAAARAPWGTINRQIIVAKAVEMVADGAGDGLSLRSLATELGVTPMALYRHVDNKDDLLDAVVDQLLADRWRPSVSPHPWQRWVAEAADRLRRFLVEEPLALQVYLRRPLTSPTALARMEAVLSVLRDALGDDARAHAAYATVQTYTLGFAAVEAARDAAARSASIDEAPPTVRELAAYTSPEQFARGLDYLLRGLAST